MKRLGLTWADAIDVERWEEVTRPGQAPAAGGDLITEEERDDSAMLATVDAIIKQETERGNI